MDDLLRINNLHTRFFTRNGVVHAVDGVSLSIGSGERIGIVGESGCGKSALCQSVMGLIPQPPGEVRYDELSFDGKPLVPSDETAMSRIRGRYIAMVFQDPLTSLNPYMRIGDQLIEPLIIHGITKPHTAISRAIAALQTVGIDNPEKRVRQYPHEFSGGMRQRASIAMALITQPKLLIADEPTTALDVTIQAQILRLLDDLQRTLGLSIILVTHDFGVAATVCDRIIVMYAGIIVESASTAALFEQPQHPYTQALLGTLPARAQSGKRLNSIPGQPPDLAQKPEGCPFAPRCSHVADVCRQGKITLQKVRVGHFSACVRVQNGDIKLS